MIYEFLKSHAERLLWHPDLVTQPGALRFGVRLLRYPYSVLRDTIEGQLTLRAMSLVYTSLLSLVPLIAFSFSVLKGFGVHWQAEPFLREFMLPLGEKGTEITTKIMTFVENVRVDVLGFVGLAFLIYTVISLIQKVEGAFNFVWQVDSPRNFAQRFSEYLSLLLIGPVAIFIALGLIGAVTSHALVERVMAFEQFGSTLVLIGKLIPFAVVVMLFSFTYAFVPNARVRIRSALVGGVTAGVLWTATGKLFASFVANSAQYDAIYSGFAIVIIALIWIYLSWMILLLGAQIAFYHQNPILLRSGRDRVEVSNALRERLALLIMYLVAEQYRHGPAGWTQATLATRLGLPARALTPLMDALERAGMLVRSEADCLLPGRDPETILLTDIVGAARGGDGSGSPARSIPLVDSVMKELQTGIAGALNGRSLKDLLDSGASAALDSAPASVRRA